MKIAMLAENWVIWKFMQAMWKILSALLKRIEMQIRFVHCTALMKKWV